MDDFFDAWCEATEETDGRKTLWRAAERENSRADVLDELASRARSHYASDADIADFLDALDYAEAADVLRTLYPQGATGRSADLGEILGAEIVEEWCGFDVPIRKLRYKDHREQAMRGEDVIGVRHDDNGRLNLLKGECKSAQALSAATVAAARSGLEANFGRPTAHAMTYFARKLLESVHDEEKELGKEILRESIRAAVPKRRIAHCAFFLTGNPADDMIDDDYSNADGDRTQYVIQIRIPDHADFVAEVYERVTDLALD